MQCGDTIISGFNYLGWQCNVWVGCIPVRQKIVKIIVTLLLLYVPSHICPSLEPKSNTSVPSFTLLALLFKFTWSHCFYVYPFFLCQTLSIITSSHSFLKHIFFQLLKGIFITFPSMNFSSLMFCTFNFKTESSFCSNHPPIPPTHSIIEPHFPFWPFLPFYFTHLTWKLN